MRKNVAQLQHPRSGRVLARVLAEDLRNIIGGGGRDDSDPTTTPEITGGGTDVTNLGPDGD